MTKWGWPGPKNDSVAGRHDLDQETWFVPGRIAIIMAWSELDAKCLGL